MAAVVVSPLPGAGWWPRVSATVRGMVSRRALLRLAGIPTVTLEGRVHVVRAVPLGVARELVPALIRCSRRFAAWQIDESLYDDIVSVLALGLGCPRYEIERLTVEIWSLAPVIEAIAQVNGLPMLEVDADLGKRMAVLAKTLSTGTACTDTSSMPPGGHGTTSIAS